MHFVILILLVISLLNKNAFYIAIQESIYVNWEGELREFGTRIIHYLVLDKSIMHFALKRQFTGSFYCMNITNLCRSSSMKDIASFQSISFASNPAINHSIT